MFNLYSEVFPFFGNFSLYTPMKNGVAKRDPAHVTSKVNLCMFKSVAPRGRWPKYHICPLFGPDMKTEMGVVIFMYLKHSLDYIDCNYIGFMGLTPLV